MLKKIKEESVVEFVYKNWKGETRVRKVFVRGFFYGETEHHPLPQFFLIGLDLDKTEVRHFAVNDICEVIKVSQEED